MNKHLTKNQTDKSVLDNKKPGMLSNGMRLYGTKHAPKYSYSVNHFH